MSYNRLIPLVIGIIITLGLELLLFKPALFYAIIVIVNIILVFGVWRLVKASFINHEWWHFSILPVSLFSSLVSYIILLKLDDFWLLQGLLILTAIILYFYYRFCYYYLLRPASYKVASIENLSSYSNFLSYYFVAAAMYGLQSFLDLATWILILTIGLVSVLLVYQLFWVSKIAFKKSAVHLFVVSMCLLELAWGLSFWPLNYHVVGLSLAIGYYLLVNFSRFHLLGSLDKEKVKYNLWFVGVSLLILWLTARWL